MSIIDKVKSLIEDSHATGYASELPASVTRVFEELAGEIEKIKPAAAAPLASIEQLADSLRQELADAIAGVVGKVEQDLDAKLAAAEAAISGRLADVFKAWAAKQAGGAAQEPAPQSAPATAAAAAQTDRQPQPAAPAATAGPAETPPAA